VVSVDDFRKFNPIIRDQLFAEIAGEPAVYLHSLETATGRASLQNIAAEALIN